MTAIAGCVVELQLPYQSDEDPFNMSSKPAQHRSRKQNPRGAADRVDPVASESTKLSARLLGILTFLFSTLVCWLFWKPLWTGGGLIGGDLYPYYLPQKAFLSQSLQAGIIPLWNNLVGFGYPVLGESQTAALYPPNLVLFSLFEVNTAYNASQVGHYLFAFWGSFLLMRRWGLQPAGSLLAATAFVYGWFPARICLEWAIIGGAWFVWILWAATLFLQTGQRKYVLLVTLFLGLDLLAGHYHLAFITLLTLVPLPWMVAAAKQSETKNGMAPDGMAPPSMRKVWPGTFWLWGALTLGFCLAAVQLLPSWELKGLSQRKEINDIFSPAYGHLPVQAISQLWMPWAWYAGEASMDDQLSACQWLRVPHGTNQTEAQLYVGLLTLLLAILSLCLPSLRTLRTLQSSSGWLLLLIASLILATGWPTYLFPLLPGLNFFRGPGRYSMVAALALSLLGGTGLDATIKRLQLRPASAMTLVTVILMVTIGDLWSASRQYDFGVSPYLGRKVFYAVLLDHPPIKFLSESPLRDYFQHAGDTGNQYRLYAPGANLPTLLGVSALPVYLGLGPAIYESEELQFELQAREPTKIAEEADRLRRLGVTHLLLEAPLTAPHWPVTSLGLWRDPFLGAALGRQTPFSLYALNDALGRVSLEAVVPEETLAPDVSANRVRKLLIEPNRVRVEVECHTDCRLILRDLNYPGWTFASPHHSAHSADPLFRTAELVAAESQDGLQTVEWVYRPRSVLIGLVVSILTLTGLAACSFLLPLELIPSPHRNERHVIRPPA